MKNSGRKMIDIINSIRKILNSVIILIFLVMFGIVTINVLARYIFNAPIPWAGELSRYSFIGIIYLGAILAMKDEAHIGLDIIIEYFPIKLREIVDFISKVLILIFLAVFIYMGTRMSLNNINTKSSAMLISMAIPYAVLPIGGLGMFVELLINLLGIEKKSYTEKISKEAL